MGELTECTVCHEKAMQHGGQVVKVVVDDVRHWRPYNNRFRYNNGKESKRGLPTPKIFCSQD